MPVFFLHSQVYVKRWLLDIHNPSYVNSPFSLNCKHCYYEYLNCPAVIGSVFEFEREHPRYYEIDDSSSPTSKMIGSQ